MEILGGHVFGIIQGQIFLVPRHMQENMQQYATITDNIQGYIFLDCIIRKV